jgi:hypothetical protein
LRLQGKENKCFDGAVCRDLTRVSESVCSLKKKRAKEHFVGGVYERVTKI